MNEIGKKVSQYYKDKLDHFGPGAQGVGWRNEEKQEKRFLQFLRLIEGNKKFSINDLGCGTGDLLPFLIRNDYTNISYRGYDVLDEMLTLAARQQLSFQQGSFHKIKNASELEVADYTVASGIFNLRYSIKEEEWLRYITDTILQMNNNSKLGFAFNMLTKYSDKEFMEEHLYYADPLFMFDHCKVNCSPDVALLHDYNEFDFTILVRK